MLKNISNLGKALNKAEQKEVHGGLRPSAGGCCNPSLHCCDPCNINYSGVGCMYQYGDPNAWPVPYCI